MTPATITEVATLPRKPIACPSCGALVSSGRLSCPACGTLVASVSGGPKPATEATPSSVSGPVSAARPSGQPASGQPTPAGAAGARPRPAQRRTVTTQPTIEVPAAGASAPADSPAPAPRPAASEVPSTDSGRTRPGSILRQLETRPPAWRNAPAGPEGAPTPEPAIPGAYLAPSAAFTAPLLRPRPGRPTEPVSPAPPASAYATSATATALPVAFAPSFSPPASDAPASAATAGRVGLSLQAPAELPGWLAIAGSAIAAVSFLMPWSRDGVIGAVGSGYFDRWGLANAGYLPLVVAALALLAVNGIPNPIPNWIRAGLAQLSVGGILFGLDWAYQTRPYSDGLGVTLLLVASLVLMTGGMVGVRSGRHSVAPPLV